MKLCSNNHEEICYESRHCPLCEANEEIRLHKRFEKKKSIKNELINCYDCQVHPGQQHLENCDVERCSVCGGQKLSCDCQGHDKDFAKWTGIRPGEAESNYLNIDLNAFHELGFYKYFFIKKAKKF